MHLQILSCSVVEERFYSVPQGVHRFVSFDQRKQIRVGGDLLGAISVSGAPGGDKDDVCVDAGLAKLKK